MLTSGGPTSPGCKLARTYSTTQGSPGAQADGNMYNMLVDLVYVGSSAPIGSWLNQEYDNLTIGHPYSLRIYYRSWSANRLQNVGFNGEGTWQAYTNNPLDEDAGGAHYIAYDFTAAATNVYCYMSNLVANGSAMIFAATLEDTSYPSGPFVTYQPKATVVGNPSWFTVSAIGTAPLAYQWYHNSVSNYSGATPAVDGAGYSGATSSQLIATNSLLDYYFVVITNNYGSVTSAMYQINPVPVIVTQPTTVNQGNTNVVYSMSAGGFPPLAYQWYHNSASNYSGAIPATDGTGYSGSTTSALKATVNLMDYYLVIVTNSYGSITSAITYYNPLPYITAQPAPYKAGSAVGFDVAAGGWPALTYQWYINSVSNYDGATVLSNGGGVSGATTTNVIVSDLTSYYYMVAANSYGSTTTKVAQVAGPLNVIGAGQPIWARANPTNILVLFNDMLDAVTATAMSNYSLDNGASILSATLVASNEVRLTTSVLNSTTAYTLTVQNVKDYFGISMATSPSYLTIGTYPVNLGLWLNAATSVTTDPDTNTVSQWNDLSGNYNNFSQGDPSLKPQLFTNSWGDPVIRFGGAGTANYMFAYDSPTLGGIIGDISIIAVMNFATNTGSHIISSTGNPKRNIPAPFDYNMGGNGATLLRGDGINYGACSATSGPTRGVPHIVAVSETGNTISHYLDGRFVSSGTLSRGFQESGCYDYNQGVWIGERSDGNNILHGDIAEVIVAGSPVSSYDADALSKYLGVQHNIPLVPTNLVVSVSNNQLIVSWPADHTGWQLQSNSIGLNAPNAWFTVSGSTATNRITITPDPSRTNLFYRMMY